MLHRFTVLRVILALLLVVTFSLTASHTMLQRSSRFSIMGHLTAGDASAFTPTLPIRPSDAFVYQGYLTDSGGTPLTGVYTITFRLYRADSTGTLPSIYYLMGTEVVAGIPVTKGLFTASIEGFGSYFTGEYQLYLGIQVGSDPEMTPYQAVASAPIALGLHPGTVIKNTATDEPGLEVHSVAAGTTGAAVIAQSDRASSDGGGIGLAASAQGGDAAIVAQNNGSGPLFRGFGSNGGNDEIRINNDGSIETTADSYIFVPAGAFTKEQSTDSTRWYVSAGGSVAIYSGASAGGPRKVYFPITLPTVLYGQSVEVKSITVYYQTSNGSNAAIWVTDLKKSTGTGMYTALQYDSTHRTSTTATSYTLAVPYAGTLSSNDGVGLFLSLHFTNDSDYVEISGIRIQLGHYPVD
jgi:hypothetical protein